MPNELIHKAQRRILNAILREYHAVVSRSSADQSHIAHLLLVLPRTKGTRRGDLAEVIAVGKLYAKHLLADEWMRKINGVRNRISLRRIDRDKLVAFVQLERMTDAKISPRTPLLSNSGLLNQFDKRPSAAIQDGQFEVVQLDDGVIDTSSGKS